MPFVRIYRRALVIAEKNFGQEHPHCGDPPQQPGLAVPRRRTIRVRGVWFRGCHTAQALKSVLPMTRRSDIPCPRPFKRDNVFYHVREEDLFRDLILLFWQNFSHISDLASRQLVRLRLDRRAEACQNFGLTQAHG